MVDILQRVVPRTSARDLSAPCPCLDGLSLLDRFSDDTPALEPILSGQLFDIDALEELSEATSAFFWQ